MGFIFKENSILSLLEKKAENKFVKFVENDDKDCMFALNSHGYLYAKGNNNFGQLGTGVEGMVSEFTRVKLSSKVKFLSSGGQKTVCITC